MQRLWRAEAGCPDVIGFQYIENLNGMNATRARRRRTDDLGRCGCASELVQVSLVAVKDAGDMPAH
jgi:hypothetical protein